MSDTRTIEQQIYDELTTAPKLGEAVAALSDSDLAQILGALNREEVEEWPAQIIHAECIAQAAKRFMERSGQ